MSDVTRVLVVDDAAFMRRTLIKILRTSAEVEVVGEARNGVEAVTMFNELRPDVVCLDVDMPQMDGVTALKHFMATRPTPVIVISSMTDRADIPFELFRLGVIEFFPKPSAIEGDLEKNTQQLLYLIKNSRDVRVQNLARVPLQPRKAPGLRRSDLPHVVVMAGLVGSIGSFIKFLSLLPHDAAHGFGMMCMVPIHRAIAGSFLESVGRYFGWETRWLTSSDDLCAGRVCMIPPGTRVKVKEDDSCEAIGPSDTALDELFAGSGVAMGSRCSLILLAGTEPQGGDGLASAYEAGAQCYVQDPRTALFTAWVPGTPVEVPTYDLEAVVDLIADRVLGQKTGAQSR
jgi:two-component system chemotaxis response regulator CheB